MENIFDKIDETIYINEQLKQSEKLKNELLAPAVTDLRKVNRVLEMVIDIYVHSPEVDKENYSLRDYFILVAALLYCPRVCVGQVFTRGLRIAIGNSLGLSPTHVSSRIRQVWEWCQNYKAFKKSILAMYEQIMTQLAIEEALEVRKRVS